MPQHNQSHIENYADKRGAQDKNAPKMAKRLDVQTMKGSRVTPKTAGMEST